MEMESKMRWRCYTRFPRRLTLAFGLNRYSSLRMVLARWATRWWANPSLSSIQIRRSTFQIISLFNFVSFLSLSLIRCFQLLNLNQYCVIHSCLVNWLGSFWDTCRTRIGCTCWISSLISVVSNYRRKSASTRLWSLVSVSMMQSKHWKR